METRMLKEYLEYFDERKFIKRNLELPDTSSDIVAVIGPRRVGKTWLLLKHAKEREKEGYEVAYLNFDDPVVKNYRVREIFDTLIKEKFDYVYLDEIQNIPNWELWIRRLHSLKGENIFITGSSFDLSQQKIPTSLRGRYISYLLLPFSYSEIEKFMSLEDYLHIGGFPEVIKLKDKGEIKRKHIALIDTIFYRDIVEHNNIRNIIVAKKMLEYLLFNYSNLISVSKIAKTFNSWNLRVSKKTIWQYTEYFKKAFLFNDVRFYSHSYKKIMQHPYKNYIIDTGIIHTYTGKLDYGRCIENIVALELIRREKEIYYYKVPKVNYEVDFVVISNGKIEELVQVVYEVSNVNVLEREIRALLHAKEDLKLSEDVPLTIITWDYEDTRDIEWWRKKGRIRFVPLWKWLLGIE